MSSGKLNFRVNSCICLLHVTTLSSDAGQPSSGACFWCSGAGSLVACNHCPRCFCYTCYKQRHSYGIINWAKVLRETDFHCAVCTGKEPPSNEGGKLLLASGMDMYHRFQIHVTGPHICAASSWQVSSMPLIMCGCSAIPSGMRLMAKSLLMCILQIQCLAPNAPLQQQGRSLQAAGGALAGASSEDGGAGAGDGSHAALLTEM